MRCKSQNGFTLAELFVVSILFILLLALGLKVVNPKDYSSVDRDAQRRIAVASIAEGVKAYVAVNGSLPPGITKKSQVIGSFSGELNLCTALVPKYLKQLPIDPTLGRAVKCFNDDQYISGYSIAATGSGNQVIVKSDGTEGSSKPISATD